MLKTLFTKYFLEVVPSIVATVVGAYIVTHYINAKPEADKPQAAVSAPAASSRDAAKETAKKSAKADAGKEAAKAEASRVEIKAETSKAEISKSEAGKAASPKVEPKPEAVAVIPDKPAAEREPAAETRQHPQLPKATAAKAAPVETPAMSDERRDANDLARAAIERLRGSEPKASEAKSPEPVREREADAAARTDEPKPQPKLNSVVYAPVTPLPQSSVQPLPPAVNIAPAPVEASAAPQSDTRMDDPSRPTPPADIPSRLPELRANRPSVAEGVVSAAKSVFQAVVPLSSN